MSSGPESRQWEPSSGVVPVALAAAVHAALPGAPNMKYWVVMRALSLEASYGCLEASVTAL